MRPAKRPGRERKPNMKHNTQTLSALLLALVLSLSLVLPVSAAERGETAL